MNIFGDGITCARLRNIKKYQHIGKVSKVFCFSLWNIFFLAFVLFESMYLNEAEFAYRHQWNSCFERKWKLRNIPRQAVVMTYAMLHVPHDFHTKSNDTFLSCIYKVILLPHDQTLWWKVERLLIRCFSTYISRINTTKTPLHISFNVGNLN